MEREVDSIRGDGGQNEGGRRPAFDCRDVILLAEVGCDEIELPPDMRGESGGSCGGCDGEGQECIPEINCKNAARLTHISVAIRFQLRFDTISHGQGLKLAKMQAASV